MKSFLVTILLCAMSATAQDYTRGPGKYPGAPAEFAGPSLKPDSGTERNLALRRAAWHSSAYDYNLTAQLVTDGIKDTKLPRRLVVTTSSHGVLPIDTREMMFDQNWVTTVDLKGKHAWVQIETAGGDGPFTFDHVDLLGSARAAQPDLENWSVVLTGSDDGKVWHRLAHKEGVAPPTGEFAPSLKLAKPAKHRFLRFEFLTGRPLNWQIGEINLKNAGKRVVIAGPANFTSAWMPAAGGEQWVYVDLGAKSSISRVALSWIRRAQKAAIQISDDAATWTTAKEVGTADTVALDAGTSARYVRLLVDGPEPCILSELEVFGKGGLVVEPKPAPAVLSDGRLNLTGGAWKLQRDTQVTAAPRAVSTVGFADRDWLVATVPGTVLTSFLNAGAIPDPNWGIDQLQISDSYFQADFWYRNEFMAPAVAAGKRSFLNFAGINWKADVYLNGEKLGRIEGAFTRARFDVTGKLRPGQKNAVAVKIEKNATPGIFKEKTFDNPNKNGGALGADNPTFHSSIGWDWIPTIHGRESGIWNEVFLTTAGAVTVDSPYVSSKLRMPDTNRADLTVEVKLHNHTAAPVTGVLRGKIGDVTFEQEATIPPTSDKALKLTPETHAQLRFDNPKLWWPNGYGAQDLYPVDLRFEVGSQLSDEKKFNFGIRQFTYSEEGGALKMWINGRRFIPRGGNWGFSESMLRYRAREYDVALRYHRDSNFTMVRNWVGQIGEDAFYEACDRHGIVVWQDFWLANPWDGPNPDDNALFLRNVRDTVDRIRNHASIGLYCGRNEGYPPQSLEDGIRAALADLHPGIHYIPSSADDVVSGHGPYQVMSTKFYFQNRATPKMHSELGMPNIMTLDSVRDTGPEADWWPQGRQWGVHDFSLHGAQGGESFRGQIERNYGGAKSAEEWISLAQFINYEGHRAMFEAQSKHRMGLLIWMSHPTWPSFVWQTYDYFFDTSAGYYGAKKASEPLHIQWNPTTNNVEVVNLSAGAQISLTAKAEIRNLDGSVAWTKSATLDAAEDSTATPIAIEFPAGLSAVHFVKLTLSRNGEVVSDNFYWRGAEEGNYKPLRDLPKVKLEVSTAVEQRGSAWMLTTTLRNTTATPALLVRAKVVRDKSGDRIVPALANDNYVSLLPGESKVLHLEVADADTRGERPRVVVEGFNIVAQ